VYLNHIPTYSIKFNYLKQQSNQNKGILGTSFTLYLRENIYIVFSGYKNNYLNGMVTFTFNLPSKVQTFLFHCASALNLSRKPAKVGHDSKLMRNTRNYMWLRNIRNSASARAQLMAFSYNQESRPASKNQCPETNPEI